MTASKTAISTNSNFGLKFFRHFTTEDQSVWDTVKWETRTAEIKDVNGDVIFRQEDIACPSEWSQLALNIVAQKYFRGTLGTIEREKSVRQLIERVANTFLTWGQQGNYFSSPADATVFYEELVYILLHQRAAFNSPVWFNLGWPGRQQSASACYITEVDDTMESILDLYKTEGMLFKDGSGSGINLSNLRSSKDGLAAGGKSSGPVSFMKGLDASAGSIKSGGSTRRAACMRILEVQHPDILDFINCKKDAELKAHALIEAGFDGAFNVRDGAYDSVPFQNANHSVRVSDEFMKAVEAEGKVELLSPVTGLCFETIDALSVMQDIAEATWVCGDPGLQFDDTINTWNTCSETARIRATNPCSEHIFLDSTACNLASINLLSYYNGPGANDVFDIEGFEYTVSLLITAQEISVGYSDFPTQKIAEMSRKFRPLGLGYANLGALLMSCGIGYDSNKGRDLAAALTSLMTASAYLQSAKIAQMCGGAFEGYAENVVPMLNVINKHRTANKNLSTLHKRSIPCTFIIGRAQTVWNNVYQLGSEVGFRNAQMTVLAPTGTIGFLMDCSTTGIEPAIALVSYKTLVGGGNLKLINHTVETALISLSYTTEEISDTLRYIEEHDTIEGAPCLKAEHLPVFDCAFQPQQGSRFIHHMGHLRMMSAVQPFLSGAISKSVNVPNSATVDEIMQIYIAAWKLGIKAVAIYRDGSKKTQPLNTGPAQTTTVIDQPQIVSTEKVVQSLPRRTHLEDERQALIHKFSIAGNHEGYITVGMYPDGTPGELFVTMAKEGSIVSGLMDGFATVVSIALQYGVPLPKLAHKFIHTRFEPNGFTPNQKIPHTTSILDYIFRWLLLKFPEDESKIKVQPIEVPTSHTTSVTVKPKDLVVAQTDAPPCPDCGSLTVRNGSCYRCYVCGASLGCS